MLASRTASEGEKTLKDCIAESGGRADDFIFVPTDVTKMEDNKKLHEKAIEKFGGYDGLILNSGGGGAKNTFLQWDDSVDGFHDGWIEDLKLNLMGPLYSARLACKMWAERDVEGVVVFTVSYYAYSVSGTSKNEVVD